MIKPSLPLIVGGLSTWFLISAAGKPVPKKVSKKVEEDPYEEFPKDIDVKINEENIYKYFSKTPIFIKSIPDIYNELEGNLKDYYNPESEFGNEKSFILINPDFAITVWNYARSQLINFPNKYSGKTGKDASILTKEILLKFNPGIYWKEGLSPYAYKSVFYYVWNSVSFLIRVAYADIHGLNQDFVPQGVE